jgi:hypothetical protein
MRGVRGPTFVKLYSPKLLIVLREATAWAI